MTFGHRENKWNPWLDAAETKLNAVGGKALLDIVSEALRKVEVDGAIDEWRRKAEVVQLG